jgi:hypothetical protein
MSLPQTKKIDTDKSRIIASNPKRRGKQGQNQEIVKNDTQHIWETVPVPSRKAT